MTQTYINQLKNHIGQSVTVKGWLYNKRSSGKLVFLQLRDGTGIVQGVVFKPNDEALYDVADSLGQESSIISKLPTSSRQRAFHMILRASAHAVE